MVTFEIFLTHHTLDPNEDPGFANWSKAQWLTWLGGRDIGRLTEPINSIVIGTREAIQNTFTPNSHPYRSHYFWSSRQFRIFAVLYDQTSETHRAYDCHNLYFACDLDDEGRPKHFVCQFDSRPANGNAQISFTNQCTLIN